MTVQQDLHDYILSESPVQAPDDFDDDYDLIESGFMDSLFMMALIKHVEQQHRIEFGMNDMVPKNFKSVNVLAGFVNRKLGINN